MDDLETDAALGEAPLPKNFEALRASIIESNITMLPRLKHAGQRAQHPKVHATVPARFEVHALKDADARYAVGLFAAPTGKPYEAQVRFSNSRLHIDNGKSGDAHGMAVRLFGVGGERLLADETAPGSFDFVLMDNETFFDGDLERYAKFNAVAAPAVDARRNGDSEVATWYLGTKARLWGLWNRIISHVKDTSDQKLESVFATDYWSTTPYKLGMGPGVAVKYRMKPRARNDEGNRQIAKSEDFLHQRMRDSLALGDQVFDLYLQVQSDPDEHPIEDPTVPWVKPEGDAGVSAREVKVATLTIPATKAVSDARWEELRFGKEGTGYNIWNVTHEHRPMGLLNRVRGEVYRALKEKRDMVG